MCFRYDVEFWYHDEFTDIKYHVDDIIMPNSVQEVANIALDQLKLFLDENRHMSYKEFVEMLNKEDSSDYMGYSISLTDMLSFRPKEKILQDFHEKLHGKTPTVFDSYEKAWKYLVGGYIYFVKIRYDGSAYIERFAYMYNPNDDELVLENFRCEPEDADNKIFEKFQKGDVVHYHGAYAREEEKDDLYIMEFDWYRKPVNKDTVHFPIIMDIKNLRTGDIIIEVHPMDIEPVRPSTDEERLLSDKEWAI